MKARPRRGCHPVQLPRRDRFRRGAGRVTHRLPAAIDHHLAPYLAAGRPSA